MVMQETTLTEWFYCVTGKFVCVDRGQSGLYNVGSSDDSLRATAENAFRRRRNALRKILSVFVVLMLLCTMLPRNALAAYDATKPACQKPGHEKFDGADHDRPQSCWVTGHFGCDGMDHARAVCGKWGHFNCDGKDHSPNACGAEGHFVCDKQNHAQAACGLAGHCTTDGLRHTAAVCGAEGHYACDGMKHKAAACGTAGHMGCDGADHGKAACGKAGHKACDGKEHALAACGKAGHCISDGKAHEAAACGVAGHTLCDGKNHGAAACDVEGHYACSGGHQHKPMSKYCNAQPQHMVCQGDAMHYCDPAQGGCGRDYLCSKSNAHTNCRMCGLLWCNRSLGSHETPCGNASHRPCVYTLNDKTYVKAEHETCWWCGEYKCNGEKHGDKRCVSVCKQCGNSKRYNKSHKMECGHYGCVESRIPHELCTVCGEGYTCDPKHHHFRPGHGHHDGHGKHDKPGYDWHGKKH